MCDRPRARDIGLRNRRGSVPVLSTVLLVGMVVVLAATVASAGFAIDDAATSDPAPMATLSMSASGDRLVFVHRGGDSLDARTLRLRISVDGEPLTHQPELPFFSQRGFKPGPTGPFNSASDPNWQVGERATLRVAASNRPSLTAGATVEVRVVAERGVIAQLSTTVEPAEERGR